MKTALLALAPMLLLACAREPSRSPRFAYGPGYASGGWPGPSPWLMPASHPSSLHGPEPGVTPGHLAPKHASAVIPGGDACLRQLDQLGVRYERLQVLKGVDTPVRITGPIGPLRFVAGAGLPFHCDCRLAVALAWSAPHLAELGVVEARYSGVYVNRRMRSGKPSRHAQGLAIDVHGFRFAPHGDGNAPLLDVKSSYRRGLTAGGCNASPPETPALNRVACRLRSLGLYKELLTPDFDGNHHNHFHLAIAPLE